MLRLRWSQLCLANLLDIIIVEVAFPAQADLARVAVPANQTLVLLMEALCDLPASWNEDSASVPNLTVSVRGQITSNSKWFVHVRDRAPHPRGAASLVLYLELNPAIVGDRASRRDHKLPHLG